jgi:hypothetical protein
VSKAQLQVYLGRIRLQAQSSQPTRRSIPDLAGTRNRPQINRLSAHPRCERSRGKT